MALEAAASLPAPDLILSFLLHIGEQGGGQLIDGIPCLPDLGQCVGNAIEGFLSAGYNFIKEILTFVPDLILYTPHPEPGLSAWYTGSGLDEPWQSLYDRTYSQSVMLATILLMVQLFFIFFFASVSPFLGSYQKERLFRRWILALIGVWGWVQLAGTALAFAHFFPQTIESLGSRGNPDLSGESIGTGDVLTTVMILLLAWVMGPTILLGVVAMYALRNLLLITYLYGMPLLIALWPIDIGFMKPISNKSKTWMQKFVPLLIMTIPNAFLLKVADIIKNTPGSFTDMLIGIDVEGTVSTALFQIVDFLVVLMIPLVAMILPKFIFGTAGQAFSMGKKLNASGTMSTPGASSGDDTPSASPGGQAAATSGGGSGGASAGGGGGGGGGGSNSPPRITNPDSKVGKAADLANSARKKASYVAPNEVKMGRHTIASQDPDRFQRRAYNQTKRGVVGVGSKAKEAYQNRFGDEEGVEDWGVDSPDTVEEAQQRAAESKETMDDEEVQELVRDAKGTHQSPDVSDDEKDLPDERPDKEEAAKRAAYSAHRAANAKDLDDMKDAAGEMRDLASDAAFGKHDDTDRITADDFDGPDMDPEGRKNLARRKLDLNPQRDDIGDDEVQKAYETKARTTDDDEEMKALKTARNTLYGEDDLPAEPDSYHDEVPGVEAVDEDTKERAVDASAAYDDDRVQAEGNVDESTDEDLKERATDASGAYDDNTLDDQVDNAAVGEDRLDDEGVDEDTKERATGASGAYDDDTLDEQVDDADVGEEALDKDDIDVPDEETEETETSKDDGE